MGDRSRPLVSRRPTEHFGRHRQRARSHVWQGDSNRCRRVDRQLRRTADRHSRTGVRHHRADGAAVDERSRRGGVVRFGHRLRRAAFRPGGSDRADEEGAGSAGRRDGCRPRRRKLARGPGRAGNRLADLAGRQGGIQKRRPDRRHRRPRYPHANRSALRTGNEVRRRHRARDRQARRRNSAANS